MNTSSSLKHLGHERDHVTSVDSATETSPLIAKKLLLVSNKLAALLLYQSPTAATIATVAFITTRR